MHKFMFSVAILVTGCATHESMAPDAAPTSSCDAKAPCSAFCNLGESSWKCDDNGRCVCDYRRDGAEAFVDCLK